MSERFGSRQQAAEHLRVADARWTEAVRTFHEYPERLRRLAAAAEDQRKAFMFAEICGVTWRPRESARGLRLAPELREPYRPGPPSLWKSFDAAERRFGEALAGDALIPIAEAFGEMARAATDIADALEQGAATSQTG